MIVKAAAPCIILMVRPSRELYVIYVRNKNCVNSLKCFISCCINLFSHCQQNDGHLRLDAVPERKNNIQSPTHFTVIFLIYSDLYTYL